MKNNYLKIFCTFILSLAICSAKAQSLQQKYQADMNQRKTQVNKVLLKAKQQEMQQKAETTNGVNSQQTAPVQPSIQTTSAQQQQKEIKSQVTSTKQKQLTTRQKNPARKESTHQ